MNAYARFVTYEWRTWEHICICVRSLCDERTNLVSCTWELSYLGVVVVVVGGGGGVAFLKLMCTL